jgi:hypothetical protein
MLTTIKLYSQEVQTGTTTVSGKLIDVREHADYEGKVMFFATIENSKKENEVILVLSGTRVLIGKKEENFESIKKGSEVTIEYKSEPNGKIAVWVYMDAGKDVKEDEKKDEDTTELNEEEEEQAPAPAEEREEEKSE